jgi:hypothetical protein
MKFTSDVPGRITGMRFYKGPQNTGTHIGKLWNAAGVELATAPFSGESASGWQSVTFDEPVTITAGTSYVVSYWSSAGRYAVNLNAFSGQGADATPLHVPTGGGLYRYGNSSSAPQNASTHNFWVDVAFQPAS